MRIHVIVVAAIVLIVSGTASAQGPWIAEGTVGWAGFVDDATKNYLAVGGSLRRQVTPRISIGPEVVVMSNSGEVRDRNVLLTGNVVFDLYPMMGSGSRRVTPFVVGGAGIFWGRDQVGNGPFWFSDPAFTAGGGVRARISDNVSAAADYRIGWELHQRIGGSVALAW
jgi:Outer membrane protein beta-barrel domain